LGILIILAGAKQMLRASLNFSLLKLNIGKFFGGP